MTLLRSLFLALALLLAFPATARCAQTGDPDWLYRGSDIARDPAWRFGTLPNGLRYAVRRNALPAGQVSIRIRIDAGSLHEEDGERGWAHFVEHMLFRGTENFPDRRARADLAGAGRKLRQRQQRLHRRDRDRLPARTCPTPSGRRSTPASRVLAEMMSRARFDPAAVEGERPVVLAEKGRRPELTPAHPRAEPHPLLRRACATPIATRSAPTRR